MELEIISDSSVHNLILKRKRTQRQRPCMNSFSSSDVLPMLVSSPEELLMLSLSTEEEDQEVAKCLILLAQGEYKTYEDSPSQIAKLSSRKLWLDKKSDELGVFECKTCNRLFHSFQALGGHRASHKKQKVNTIDNESLLQKSASRSSENTCHNLQLGNNRLAGKTRVHRCLKCSAEFPSGQALGGHMRKHRVNLLEGTKVEDGSSVTLSLSCSKEDGMETTTNISEFQFMDLNLPASSSSEDEISVTRFSFASKQLQDSGLVLSSPALVDCHY